MKRTSGALRAQGIPGTPSSSADGAGGSEAATGGADAASREGEGTTSEQIEQAALVSASLQHAFGPGFFYAQLRGFALDHCPSPAAGLPVVEIHLADGDVLDLCHIIGVTPRWVALAVRESEHGTPERMRTEFVPYEGILRVTLRSARSESPHLGFEHTRTPRVIGAPARVEMSPEAAVRVAAAIEESKEV